MFTVRQRELLIILEFTYAEITNRLEKLEKRELIQEIAKKKRETLKKYHPDKNPNKPSAVARFHAACDVYDELIKTKTFNIDLFDYLDSSLVAWQLPVDCLDMRMQEQIDSQYESLLSGFLSLDGEDEKARFVNENKSFLQLVQALNAQNHEISRNRVDAFAKATQSLSLKSKLYHEWNQLIVELFAEENLDDITYREAIALGHYKDILTLRKLLSPVKWLSLTGCGAYNLLATTLSHLVTKLLVGIIADLQMIKTNPSKVFPLLGRVVIALGALALFAVLPSSVVLPVLCLPMLSRVLYHLANPVNHIIRPVAKYLGLSPLKAGLLITAIADVVVVPSIVLAATGYLIPVIMGLSLVMSLLTLISNAVMVKQLYDLSPIAGIVFGAFSAVSIGLQLLAGIDVPVEPVNLLQALTIFTSNIGMLGLAVFGNIALANLSARMSNLFSTLPMPQESVDETVKETINANSQEKHWSKTLFNTSESVKANHRPGFFDKPQTKPTEEPTKRALTFSPKS